MRARLWLHFLPENGRIAGLSAPQSSESIDLSESCTGPSPISLGRYHARIAAQRWGQSPLSLSPCEETARPRAAARTYEPTLTVVRLGSSVARMALTASKLRENIYKILDQVLETGVPVEIVRGRRRLRIVPADQGTGGKLARLTARPKALVGDPEDLVHLDWSKEWRP